MKKINKVKQCVAAWIGGPDTNQNAISFIDVKCLYDAAYEERAKARALLKTFRTKLKQAQRLEELYRAQLGIGFNQHAGKVA